METSLPLSRMPTTSEQAEEPAILNSVITEAGHMEEEPSGEPLQQEDGPASIKLTRRQRRKAKLRAAKQVSQTETEVEVTRN